jgi:hypothetical protein
MPASPATSGRPPDGRPARPLARRRHTDAACAGPKWTLELPGASRLRDAQAALDRAVGEAYAWGLPPALRDLEPLPLLLALNRRCAAAEDDGRTVAGPGLPLFCAGDGRFLSGDCLRMPER